MKFGGICIETDDAPRLAEFYKIIFGEEPFIEGSHYGFGSIAVYDPGGVIVAKDKNICLQCFVEDLDAEYEGFFLSFADYTPIGDAHVALRSEYINGTELGGTSG